MSGLIRHGGRRPWGWVGLPRATAEHAFRASAVMVVAGPVADDVAFLLVRRSWTLRHHPGEFAFPGGGIDPGETPVAAAIRECHEETGMLIDPERVLGVLPALALQASANVVAPVVAWAGDDVRSRPARRRPDRETHSTHWVPRRHLTDPEHRATVIDGEGWTGPGLLLEDSCIWGFTAKVLDWLLDELGWSRPWDTSRLHRVAQGKSARAGGTRALR
ncbi:NUDIX domain-containing protein [Geodermatophilus telluris]|uniref:NUDIX domain-containing protein n=1 Tax=Geodermatophilus telluris TaxID=1190417 RepID=A0A1G6QJZ8_9ACTN|nr:NUDIX domain-containing protein [Geodermatophilus telluris]